MFVSYAQNGEDVMLWRALKTVAQGFYIDVGGFDPDYDSVTRAFYERGWRGVNIDPLQESIQRFEQRRPLDINLNVAIGDAPGEAPFYRVSSAGLSTMDAAIARRHEAAGLTIQTRHTRIATLSEICRAHQPAVIHFLKIDCEGSEAVALRGADFATFRPWIVVVEATRPLSPDLTHAEWEPLLTAANYRFVWFDGLNRFYLAAERYDGLKHHFEAPPNVFDAYTLAQRPTEAVARPPNADPLEAATPAHVDIEQRIAMAARCRDADPIPKVAEAGGVVTLADGARVQTMHNGLKVEADGYYGSWMTELIARCHGHHEPQEERLFHEIVALVGPDATMLELGGYWAYYSAWFLLDSPRRRAIVLEPDPAHLAVGKRTMALNGLEATFLSAAAGPVPTAPTPFATDSAGEILLPRMSAPQIMAEHELDRLDILHCDIQGGELGVIESCREIFAQGKVEWLFVSTHAYQISGDPLTHQRCLALLRAMGAEIVAEHDVHELFSGDGLIVARFGPPIDWRPPALSRNRYSESLFRNPAYDLALRLRSRPDHDLAERAINAAYQTLLARLPDAAGVRDWMELLSSTGDVRRLLEGILDSAEFRGNQDWFLQRYFDQSVAGVAKYFTADGPLACSGLTFTLNRDGPLGKAGDSVNVPPDQSMLPEIFAHGGWSAESIAFVASRLDPARNYALVDIGANIGLFSRQLLNACANIAAVYCVEPDPANFQALTTNLTNFADRKTLLFNLALGQEDGVETFYRDKRNIGNYSLNPDAMRDRPFDVATAPVAAARRWMLENLSGQDAMVWKSDTQGHDELIVAHTPWRVWNRVQVATIELWRIEKLTDARAGFLDKIDRFPNKSLGGAGAVTTQDVGAYLDSTDWSHTDLFLWR